MKYARSLSGQDSSAGTLWNLRVSQGQLLVRTPWRYMISMYCRAHGREASKPIFKNRSEQANFQNVCFPFLSAHLDL
jgi:hypothetical protein